MSSSDDSTPLDATIPASDVKRTPAGGLDAKRTASSDTARDPTLSSEPVPLDATMPAASSDTARDPTMRSDAPTRGVDATMPASSAPGVVARGDVDPMPIVERDRYAVGGEVARGGMGRILRARDRRLGRDVAIKELVANDASLAVRFEREVRITARLQHPAIVAVHEAGRWPSGEPFYAMKLVDGRALDRVIAETTNVRERLALLGNVSAVVDALAYAHGQGVIHRDLKPANVLVGSFGETVVIDWGLAKELADATDDDLAVGPYRTAAGGETVAGAVLGTPAYMPPEQAAGERVDARADVYSLGALLYHVLAGEAPYVPDAGTKSVEDLLAKVLRGAPRSLAERAPELPADLVAICSRAMAREPDDRFPTAAEMADELRRFSTGQLVASHRYTRREIVARFVRKNRVALTITTVAVVVLSVGAVIGIRGVVAQRDRADQAARVSDESRRVAEDARAESDRRADQLALEQARAALETDPSRSIAALSQIRDPALAADVRIVAADAKSRGIAHTYDVGSHVHGLSLSADGTTLVAGADDGKLRVWTIGEPTPRVLSGHDHRILDAVVVGDSIVSVDGIGEVRRWNLATGAGVVIRPKGSGLYPTGSIAPTGDRVALRPGGNGERAELVTIDGGATVKLAAAYTRFAWSPDGKTLVGRSYDQYEEFASAKLDAATGWVLETLPNNRGEVTATAIDGARIAIGNVDGRVLDSNKLTIQHAGAISAIRFLPGLIVSASSDHETGGDSHGVGRRFSAGDYTVRVASTNAVERDDEKPIELRGHGGNIVALAVAAGAGGSVIASAGADDTIRVWTVPVRKNLEPEESSNASFGALQTGGSTLVLAGDSVGTALLATNTRLRLPPARPPTLTVRSVTVDGKSRFVLDEPNVSTWIEAFAASRDGARFVTLDSMDGSASVWESGRARVLGEAKVMAVAISDNGSRVAIATVDEVLVFDRDNEKIVLGKPHDQVHALAVRDDGTVVTGYSEGTFGVFAKGAPARVIGEAGEHPVAIAVAGDLLFVGGGTGGLRTLRISDGVSTYRDGHAGGIEYLVVSPDGRRVVTTSSDGSIRVWPAERGNSIVLRGHSGRVSSVAFSADGHGLVSGSDDRTVRVWDLETRTSRVGLRMGAIVVFAGYLPDGRVVGLDRFGDIQIAVDDLPTDFAQLHAWIAGAAGQFGRK